MAVISAVEYSTLDAALAAAQNGQTIRLIDDITLDTQLKIILTSLIPFATKVVHFPKNFCTFANSKNNRLIK